jgi:hypothetical protein
MDERSVNIFDDQFVLEGFDGEHELDLQSPSINPQMIPNHGGLSQGKTFGIAGLSRQASYGHPIVTKPLQRTTQQPRSSSIRNTSSSGEKPASMVGLEMRNVAQQVRTFGWQLLDVKRYESHVDQWQDLTIFGDATRLLKRCKVRYQIFRPEHRGLKGH